MVNESLSLFGINIHTRLLPDHIYSKRKDIWKYGTFGDHYKQTCLKTVSEKWKKKRKKSTSCVFCLTLCRVMLWNCTNGPSGKWLPFNTKELEAVGLCCRPRWLKKQKGAKRKLISCSLFLQDGVKKASLQTKKGARWLVWKVGLCTDESASFLEWKKKPWFGSKL